jgi:hypothetical protein
MRKLIIAPLALLASVALIIACDSDNDPDDSNNGESGDGSATDGDGVDGDGDADSDGDADGGSGECVPTVNEGGAQYPSSEECASVILSTGCPALIDDFDHGASWNFPEGSDKRVGTWEHRGYDPSIYVAGGAPGNVKYDLYCGDTSAESCSNMGMGGAAGTLTPGSLVFKCEAEDDWCNTAWDSTKPYGQYANLEVTFVPFNETAGTFVDCYNALEGGFTGIQFDIKSPTNSSVLPELKDPSKSLTTEPLVFRAQAVNATAEFQTVKLAFADFKSPDYASYDVAQRGLPVDGASLQSFALIVNPTRESGDGVEGESLPPYNIEIDNVTFY